MVRIQRLGGRRRTGLFPPASVLHSPSAHAPKHTDLVPGRHPFRSRASSFTRPNSSRSSHPPRNRPAPKPSRHGPAAPVQQQSPRHPSHRTRHRPPHRSGESEARAIHSCRGLALHVRGGECHPSRPRRAGHRAGLAARWSASPCGRRHHPASEFPRTRVARNGPSPLRTGRVSGRCC